ncbi:MAG TPA: lysylphosphatidylglycerol synthase transmembrane domain-containing protein [Polyangiaceae bacterium]|nr:lysylphosphatidylglycerol synthase transmembrane domain-containing protein [Polyangiaceae bacterium]
MNRFIRRLASAMLLGVAVYLFFALYTGVRKIEVSLSSFHWSAFGIALGLATMNYAIRFLKWQYYLKRLGVNSVPVFDSLLVFLSGFVLTVTPGKVGEIFKSAVLAKTHDVPLARTAPIVVAERLTDAIGVIVLIVVGGAAFANGLKLVLFGCCGVICGITLILWPKPGVALAAYLDSGPLRLRPIAPKLREALVSLRVVASPGALLWPTFLSVIAWSAEGFALFVILRGFEATISPAVAVFFYATATLAGALVPLPGGLGIVEGMIKGQLTQVGGVAAGPATAAMMLIRFATLWWAVIVGFAALFVLRLRFPDRLREPSSVAVAPSS